MPVVIEDPTVAPVRIDPVEIENPGFDGDLDDVTDLDPSDAPPIFGKCPVCGKPLKPRCKVTGEPKAPPVGTGFDSRAKCDRCGTLICYCGNGEWRVLLKDDLNEEDDFIGGMPLNE